MLSMATHLRNRPTSGQSLHSAQARPSFSPKTSQSRASPFPPSLPRQLPPRESPASRFSPHDVPSSSAEIPPRRTAPSLSSRDARHLELLEDQDLPVDMCPRRLLIAEEDRKKLAALVAALISDKPNRPPRLPGEECEAPRLGCLGHFGVEGYENQVLQACGTSLHHKKVTCIRRTQPHSPVEGPQ